VTADCGRLRFARPGGPALGPAGIAWPLCNNPLPRCVFLGFQAAQDH